MKKILQKIVAFRTSRFFFPTLIIFLIISLVGFLYFYFQYQQTKKIINNPQAFTKEQTKDLLNKVGKLIELTNEEPTVATITDKDKLKNQPFFKNAQNGDKVLIFTQAKKAILYRPATNKIIEVSPINIGENASQTTPTPEKSQPKVKIAILNGTKISGLAGLLENQIKEKMTDVSITKGDAKKEYKKTFFIDLTGGHEATIAQLTQFIQGESASLPESESKPNADILIILGR